MTALARVQMPLPDPFEALEQEVDSAIAVCDGDVRAALRATLIANAYLDAENGDLPLPFPRGLTGSASGKCGSPQKSAFDVDRPRT